MARKFELGEVVCTPSVMLRVQQDGEFCAFIHRSFEKYVIGDWGDTCEENRETNERAIINGERIRAIYKYPGDGTTIWVITEWDRSVTTILFPNEY